MTRVTRREFIGTAVATTAALGAARLDVATAATRPNVIFILADDLGYGDLSAYGRPDYRTLVIFTSDNGGERYSFNWPFSFQKFFLWEGGIRVPALVRWPGTIPAGRVTEQAATTMDWTATILAATGTAPDPAFPLDGVDLLPVCTGARAPFDRTLFWRTDARQAARQGRWKYLKDGNAETLFDLSIDPGEKNNLRSTHGDVFAQLQAAYLAWNAQMLPRSTRGGPQ